MKLIATHLLAIAVGIWARSCYAAGRVAQDDFAMVALAQWKGDGAEIFSNAVL